MIERTSDFDPKTIRSEISRGKHLLITGLINSNSQGFLQSVRL